MTNARTPMAVPSTALPSLPRLRRRDDVPPTPGSLGGPLRRVAMISLHTSPLDQPGTGDAGGMNVYVIELAKRLAARGAEGKAAGTRALVLAVLSLLSLAVFWTGLPAVLAAGAVACATAARTSTAAKVAFGLSALTIIGAVALAIVG